MFLSGVLKTVLVLQASIRTTCAKQLPSGCADSGVDSVLEVKGAGGQTLESSKHLGEQISPVSTTGRTLELTNARGKRHVE